MENPVVKPLTVDLLYGLNGFRREIRPIVYPINERAPLSHSLTEFAQRQNETDSFSRSILYPEEVTDDSNINISNLELIANYSKVIDSNHPSNLFFRDASLALILQNQCTENSEDAGIISFDYIPSEGEARLIESKKKYPANSLRSNDLYIHQIQGPTDAKLKGSGPHVLEGLRWPFVLVSQVILWSREIGIPRVILEPHEYNRWGLIKNNDGNRGKMRYNVTAKRMGFERPNEEGPYIWDNQFFYEMARSE